MPILLSTKEEEEGKNSLAEGAGRGSSVSVLALSKFWRRKVTGKANPSEED
jgi:hypothetical protein